jgi:hypothetical protein
MQQKEIAGARKTEWRADQGRETGNEDVLNMPTELLSVGYSLADILNMMKRDVLRGIARRYGIARGRNKADTIRNLLISSRIDISYKPQFGGFILIISH